MQQDSTASPSILGMCPYECKLGHQSISAVLCSANAADQGSSVDILDYFSCVSSDYRPEVHLFWSLSRAGHRCRLCQHWGKAGFFCSASAAWDGTVQCSTLVHLATLSCRVKISNGVTHLRQSWNRINVDFKNPPVSYWGCQFQAKLHFLMDNGLGFSVCHIRSEKCSLCIVDNPHTPL